MKYMGSKRAMLTNGLGELLRTTLHQKRAFFDLFCGAGSVSSFVAQTISIPVYSSDLQEYAVALTRTHVERDEAFSSELVLHAWGSRAREWLGADSGLLTRAFVLSELAGFASTAARQAVEAAREFCAKLPARYACTRAYGGYYFSPLQAITIDALRSTLPFDYSEAALAALIRAASSCAASPGHTAQPFSTAENALPYLINAWQRNIGGRVKIELNSLSLQFAKKRGSAQRQDALKLAELLTERDVAFIDPPYSDVQYSRFYHVLESIATGRSGEVHGSGRYPPPCERPQSGYSKKSESLDEFQSLMLSVAASGADAIVTFPAGFASNGLSGPIVEAISAQFFHVKKRKIASTFSTLGGNAVNRKAREKATELILHLEPR